MFLPLYSIDNVSLLIADEAHNAVKDYSYTWVAKQYHKKSKFPRIIGLTASPGSDLERIQNRVLAQHANARDIQALKDSVSFLPELKTLLKI